MLEYSVRFPMINKIQYKLLALGGTFDHFHVGHEGFILFAAEIAESLIIGITSQNMTRAKEYSELIQPLHVRKQAVRHFCKIHNIKAQVITLEDPYGPTIEENKIQAIACTKDTIAGAEKINEIREKLRLPELPIHVHTLLKDSEGSKTISAERIRAGEISRTGTVYDTVLKNTIELTETMRTYFSKLHGTIIEEPTLPNHAALKIAVGDTTLETFITNNWQYDLGVFDGKRQRKEEYSETLANLESMQTAYNKPGNIEQSVVITFKNWLHHKSFKHLFINGEEDLVAVVAVLLLPLGSYVYYGQPNQGIVESVVTEQLKSKFFEVLSQQS